ncbi:hypothetical protein [Prevotella sp. E2-28]|uniref:hypothetical protein n=1 Tax=Prevotella sp. E2-28 TaxID=2913620 RepID=UPI001EDC008A|nr:hypothetical protein [Prevotella sp. E2-28]UKK54023.1 hypothetical protein L6465_01760 [Prevotella sp. E2-28]
MKKKDAVILLLVALLGGLIVYIYIDIVRDMSSTAPDPEVYYSSTPTNVDSDIAVPVETIPEDVEEIVAEEEFDNNKVVPPEGIKGIEWEYEGINDEAFEAPKQTMLIETAKKMKGDTSNRGKLLCSGDYTYYAQKKNGHNQSVTSTLRHYTIYERWLFDEYEVPYDFVGMVNFENVRCRRYNGNMGCYLLVKPNGEIVGYSSTEETDIMNRKEKVEYYSYYEWGDTRDQHVSASTSQPSTMGTMGVVGVPSNINQSQPAQMRQRCITCGGTGNCSNPSSAYNSRTYCHGSGLCPLCGGDGFTENSYSTQTQRCTSCHGSGRCQHCLGTGQCPRCGGSGFM